MNNSPARVAAELRRSTGAWASAEDAILDAASCDFGGVIRKKPAVVVRPANTAQVAAVLRHATRHCIPVSVRGAGHSVGGQTLSEGGIVLDTRDLHHVSEPNVAALTIDAEPGAKWHSVVARALQHGLVPPVLTGTHGTSVGGTHSVGGLGHASHLHGTQADNCLGLEVVTAQGEVCWCDAHTRTELFEHVLCGLGQLAVITRVRLRVRRHRPFVRRWRFFYTQLGPMLRDLEALALTGAADYLAGYGFAVDGRFAYSVGIAFEADHDSEAEREAALAAVQANVVRGPIIQRFHDFMTQQPLSDDRDTRAPALGKINPWIDLLVPAAQIRSDLEDVLRCFPASLLRSATMLFWPLRRDRFTRPLFRVPEAEQFFLAGIYPTVSHTDKPDALAALAVATDRIVSAGGTRYVYAWMPFDESGWARHYGERWSALCRLKAEYDPQMILNRGVIHYSAAEEPVVAVPAAAL
ncbi:MAG: FAD-binding protein [Longimicrobiales bacterium]